EYAISRKSRTRPSSRAGIVGDRSRRFCEPDIVGARDGRARTRERRRARGRRAGTDAARRTGLWPEGLVKHVQHEHLRLRPRPLASKRVATAEWAGRPSASRAGIRYPESAVSKPASATHRVVTLNGSRSQECSGAPSNLLCAQAVEQVVEPFLAHGRIRALGRHVEPPQVSLRLCYRAHEKSLVYPKVSHEVAVATHLETGDRRGRLPRISLK